MTRRTSISDEQLFQVIRESNPDPHRGFSAADPEIGSDAMLRQILASDRSESERPSERTGRGRRTVLRTGALSVGAVLVLSGSALAAGNALGVIDLGGGDTAEPLTRVLVDYTAKDGKTYHVLVPSGTPYTYKLAGGTPAADCAVSEVIVESDRALSSEELHGIDVDESAGPTHVATDLLPEGVKAIGQTCNKLAQPATGTEREAQANAQAEAEAEGWTEEKFREELTTKMQEGGELLPFRGTPLPEAAPTGQGG